MGKVERLGIFSHRRRLVILGDGGPRHIETAKLVLTAGADPNLADRDGVSPLAHAKRRGQDAIAKLIEAGGGR